jgi:hypothetical protein
VQLVWAPQGDTLPATPGLHRWVWDLRGTPTDDGRGRGGRGAAPAVMPGRFVVRLTAAGKTLTQPLIVRSDPRGSL